MSATAIVRKMWRPDLDAADLVFKNVLRKQYESWLWRGWVAGTKPGPFPGPGLHPDAGKPFDELDGATLKIVAGNCEAVLMLFENLHPDELSEMRELGRQILDDSSNTGTGMRPELMEKVARVHHIFWLLNRELSGARCNWDPQRYKDHWGHQLWERGLDQKAKDADFIQARAHCRTLALIDDQIFDQIRAWAAVNSVS